jgi:hypothetical protein
LKSIGCADRPKGELRLSPVEQSEPQAETRSESVGSGEEERGISRKRKSDQKWSFGEGREGMFVQPTASSDWALIVGRSIPWWGMVVARIDVRIHSILLNDLRFSQLVSTHFGSEISVKKKVDQSREDILATRQALRKCSVVAMESLPKPSSVLNEMWVGSKVRLVLVAHGVLYPPPQGWKLYRNKLSHSKVGGVTNVIEKIGVYYRSTHVNLKAILGKSTQSIRPS